MQKWGGARLLEVGHLQLAPLVAQETVLGEASKVRVRHVDPWCKVLGWGGVGCQERLVGIRGRLAAIGDGGRRRGIRGGNGDGGEEPVASMRSRNLRWKGSRTRPHRAPEQWGGRWWEGGVEVGKRSE